MRFCDLRALVDLGQSLQQQRLQSMLVMKHQMVSFVGEGARLQVWKIDDQLVCQIQVKMALARYQSLGFPDIVQLAYVDTRCQFIAGCSSTGLLAIWDIR